jgi:hypothetical protein
VFIVTDETRPWPNQAIRIGDLWLDILIELARAFVHITLSILPSFPFLSLPFLSYPFLSFAPLAFHVS